MSLFTLLLTAAGLSMDAFAVSISKGLCLKRVDNRTSTRFGLYFGGFQALMPIIGYLLGYKFSMGIKAYDHWIAWVLLSLIGIKMIYEARFAKPEACDDNNSELSFSKMLPLAIATSIDALAVGVSFAFLSIDIVSAATTIGIVTFLFSFIGVKIGNIFGTKWKAHAELLGGLLLMGIGIKILLEHLIHGL